jgi:hypothetical protein
MKQSEQLKALEARIAELEAKLDAEPQPMPEPEPIRITSAPLNNRGEVIVDPNLPSYEERMAQRRAQEEATAKAEWEERTKGLPPGHWRDNSGLIRDADGNLALTPEIREREAKEAMERATGALAGGDSGSERKIYPWEE